MKVVKRKKRELKLIVGYLYMISKMLKQMSEVHIHIKHIYIYIKRKKNPPLYFVGGSSSNNKNKKK